MSGGIERLPADGRLAAGRPLALRAGGRADRCVAVRGLDAVDLGLVLAVLRVAEAGSPARGDEEPDADAAPDLAVDAVRRAEVLDLVPPDDDAALGLVADEGRRDVVRGFAVVARRVVRVVRVVPAVTVGLAADMVFAAAVSAFAAVVMAFVAVFMACIADDMVFADEVAFVAAAVIFVAADVTLVAADETVRAADAGVAVLLAEDLRPDRDAGVRADGDGVLPAGLAAVLRIVRDVVRPAEAVVLGRLAVPDALRLTDLLRAVLAELRRVAAWVVV